MIKTERDVKNRTALELIRITFAYLLVHIFTSGINITAGIIGEAIPSTLCIYILYKFVREWLKKESLTLEECFYKKPYFSIRTIFIPIGMPLTICILLMAFPGEIVKTSISPEYLSKTLIPLLIGRVITFSITEEIIFRGYMLKKAKNAYGCFWAVLSTSVLFAITHTVLTGMKMSMFSLALHIISCIVLGAIYGIITIESSSICFSMMTSILCNLIDILLSYNINNTFETPYMYICISTLPEWFNNNIHEFAYIISGIIFIMIYVRKCRGCHWTSVGHRVDG